jgi:hypothetical protein
MNPDSLLLFASAESSLPDMLVASIDFPYMTVSRIRWDITWKRAPSSSSPYRDLTLSKDLQQKEITTKVTIIEWKCVQYYKC